MRLASKAWVLSLVASGSVSFVHGFQLSLTPRGTSSIQATAATTMNEASVSASSSTHENTTAAPRHDMTYAEVNRLAFRALQRECKALGLSAVGTTAALRGRLLEHFGLMGKESVGGVDSKVAVPKVAVAEVEVSSHSLLWCNIQLMRCDYLQLFILFISTFTLYLDSLVTNKQELCATDGINFCDESDPEYDFKQVLTEVMQKSSLGHWKAATRKLKALRNKHSTPDRPVPREAYLAVLEACAADRLNGARASEPARKILEDMATCGYAIPAELANVCVVSSLGEGVGAMHDEFGGIDTALAMVAAIESSPEGSTMLTDATYGRLVSALAKEKAIEEAILVLRSMVVEKSFTPPLSTFATVAKAAAMSSEEQHAEDVLQVLTYAKAAGYELDNIAAVETGRELLASGVIASEKMDNLALGLRLLTAAAKAQGCAPDSGDALVATSSSAAQRACTLIHKKAIGKACEDDNWKLAVKLLELMPKRGLSPATSVWRKVLATCCKNEKSRKATAILLDWVST